MDKYINIKGAKENNLKNVDLCLPHNKLIVFTGISGSGKTSLAFDTIYIEGQRKYLESLSTYARQFLGKMGKPDVDKIEGLTPAVSIDQKTTTRNPRSTVGTVTEIYDFLRLLYARIGIPHCPECGKIIERKTIDQIVDEIMRIGAGTKIQLLAPVVRGIKGDHSKVIKQIRKDGFSRIIINGKLYDITDEIVFDKNTNYNIEIIIDRLKIKDGLQNRLAESAELIMRMTDGVMIADIIDKHRMIIRQDFICPDCDISINEIEPNLFSFNRNEGCCPECKGLGKISSFDKDLILDVNLSLNEGAIKLPYIDLSNIHQNIYYRIIADRIGFSLDDRLKDLPDDMINVLLYGMFGFEGLINLCYRIYNDKTKPKQAELYEDYVNTIQCPICNGKKLKREALAVTVGGSNIIDLTNTNIDEIKDFFINLKLNANETIIASGLLRETIARLDYLIDVGLSYLTLSRTSDTLSGGEAQRVRLATQIGSNLMKVLYIMDEPSIGLHQRDNERLIETLKKLRDKGNTLIVVEHDEDTMAAADFIVDFGPGAGEYGGNLVFSGTYDEIIKSKISETGAYLSGKKQIVIPPARRKPDGRWIEITGASENNLKQIDVRIPVGLMTCFTGVSGSGKSSFVNDILYKYFARNLNRSRCKVGKYNTIKGIEYFDSIIDIDQSAIVKSPKTNPAIYVGVFDDIRDLFGKLPESKARGYSASRFSFNIKNAGRCEACQGDGQIKIEMHFLSDVYINCEVCGGKRYNRETLEIKYKDKSISDVLNMSVSEALEFFKNVPKVKRKLDFLNKVGLSYIRLGQPFSTLSGGEAQRVKLAMELSKRNTGRTIYILDEPTVGLHFSDVDKLLKVLNELVDLGNTVVIVEHNLDVIKIADYIIDLGPESGENGGQIIGTGTPEDIAHIDGSITGRYLRKILGK